MSRTWRTIPHGNGFKQVRDKDNHGCTYSTPKSWRKTHYQRCRSLTNDQLNKLVNENYKNATEKDFGDVVLPKPKGFQPYYW